MRGNFCLYIAASSVHKKHNELVHLLKSGGEKGGERGEGWIVLNGKKEKGDKRGEREIERERDR